MFLGIFLRMHGRNNLQFGMLKYPSLLIFRILTAISFRESGQIWVFRTFSEDSMVGMTWNLVSLCTLTTFRID